MWDDDLTEDDVTNKLAEGVAPWSSADCFAAILVASLLGAMAWCSQVDSFFRAPLAFAAGSIGATAVLCAGAVANRKNDGPEEGEIESDWSLSERVDKVVSGVVSHGAGVDRDAVRNGKEFAGIIPKSQGPEKVGACADRIFFFWQVPGGEYKVSGQLSTSAKAFLLIEVFGEYFRYEFAGPGGDGSGTVDFGGTLGPSPLALVKLYHERIME